LHPKAFLQVADLVTPDDFYHPTLGDLRAMIELDAAREAHRRDHGRRADARRTTASGAPRVRRRGYFAELMSKVITVDNIAYHAKIVRGKATVRRLIEAAQEIAAHGYGEYGDVEEFIDSAERSMFEIAQRSQRSSYEPIRKVLGATIKVIEKRYDRKQAITGVPRATTSSTR
jgi:replicative DNA helicase